MTAITAALLVAATPRGVAATIRAAAGRPLLLAHYMPWFEADPAHRRWGWHWTMNHFDPSRMADGYPEIASHYHPLIGPYDSADPAVTEYHLLLMKLAGVDGVIVDWYGLSDLYDYPIVHRNTGLLMDAARRLGLKFAICYEDHTVTALQEAKRLAPEDRVAHVRSELAWLNSHWFADPGYVRYEDKPVLLSFGYSGLSDEEWEQALQPSKGHIVYLSEGRRRKVADGTFDWPDPQAGTAGLDRYYASVQGQSVFLPVAYPRFDDIYKQTGVQSGYPRIPDADGATFEDTLKRALESGAPSVQIATWNDWGEGTQIEPSVELQYRDLETVQRLRRGRDPAFSRRADDLRLPYRLWRLRSRQSDRPALRAALDEVARLLAAGDIPRARGALAQAESQVSGTTHPAVGAQ